jgi:hypothetical protein
VLGGARTLEERPVRILLEQPSYTTARQIERRINERFGHSPSPARADSAAAVTLRTPPAYADRAARFLELTMHLLRQNAPDYVERKLRELASEIAPPTTERLEHLSLIWEAVGKGVLPHIQPLYAHESPVVAYYAARAGLRLADATALPVVARFAEDEKSALRVMAIQELGECSLALAAPRLEPLLDSDDQAARVAAYEGLLRHRHPAVQTLRFPCAFDQRLPALTLDLVGALRGPADGLREALARGAHRGLRPAAGAAAGLPEPPARLGDAERRRRG